MNAIVLLDGQSILEDNQAFYVPRTDLGCITTGYEGDPFTAAVFVVLSGALTMEEAYRAIEWRAIFLVAAVLPVGIAMERSGAAAMIADGAVSRIRLPPASTQPTGPA